MTDQLNPDVLHSATEIKISCSTGNSCLYLPLISDGFADEMDRGFFQVWPVRLWAENTNSLWSLPLTVLVYSAGFPWWQSWEIDLPGHVQSVQSAAHCYWCFLLGLFITEAVYQQLFFRFSYLYRNFLFLQTRHITSGYLLCMYRNLRLTLEYFHFFRVCFLSKNLWFEEKHTL